MEKRTFLTFENTYARSFDSIVKVFSVDSNGHFEFIADISFRNFAKVIDRHIEISESDISDNAKLYTLSKLWRDISPEIGGYLYGDIDPSYLISQS